MIEDLRSLLKIRDAIDIVIDQSDVLMCKKYPFDFSSFKFDCCERSSYGEMRELLLTYRRIVESRIEQELADRQG